MLRFSNHLFFSNVNEVPFFSFSNARNIRDPDGFNDLLVEVMNRIVNRAAYDSSAAKFATEEANLTGFQTLYSLVQCTLDLSANDCNRCLRSAISVLPMCCNGKQGGAFVAPSCILRYEVYPFYRITATAPVPSHKTTNPTAVNLLQRYKILVGGFVK